MDNNRNSQYGLSDEQKAAVEELSKTNVYAKQSKFKTFRELPSGEKWPYFVQNFLLQTAIAAIAIAVVAAFAVSYLTKEPDPDLMVEGVGMSRHADALNALGKSFAESEGLSGKNPVQMDTGITLSSGAGQDSSMQLLAMVTAGQINMVVADAKTFNELHSREIITKPSDVMSSSQLEGIKDALVDAKGRQVSDARKAVGFDVSKSKVWTSARGLPKNGTILGFSNIEKTKSAAVKFVEFLDFE